MFNRAMQPRLLRLAEGFPVLALTGPRQSGKTTLAQQAFEGYAYVSLEDADVRERALADPRGFLAQHGDGVIIDEAQRAPELLSYLQTHVDQSKHMGRVVLTGSQNMLLSVHISQSLAGRAAYVELLPLAYTEMQAKADRMSLGQLIVQGSYPALYQRTVAHRDWLASYISTYVERDVRSISRVADLAQFQRFLRMMAARCGQLLNLNSVAADLGIAQTTARDWLHVLEASYIAYRLEPYFGNFGKRLVKTPKLYFYDTGVCAHLLGLSDPADFAVHPMRGALFENYLINEFAKYKRNHGKATLPYFWRDNIGNEVDLLLEAEGKLWPIEFKSGSTFQSEWLNALKRWPTHAASAHKGPDMLISSAPGSYQREGLEIAHWRDAVKVLH
jgi:uncharacterized protein